MNLRLHPNKHQIMKAALAVCTLLFASLAIAEDVEKDDFTVCFRVPKRVYDAPGIIIPGVGGDGGKLVLSPYHVPYAGPHAAPGEYWLKATFKKHDLPTNPFFCYYVNPGTAFGIVQRPIRTQESEVQVDIPATLYAGNWEVPDELSRKLQLHPGSTYLVILRVIEDKDLGTVYDPNFYLWVAMRKNIRDDVFDVQFCIPFLDPGIYEFGVKGGPKQQQLLRRRVRLELGKGLEKYTDAYGDDEITGMGKKQAVTRFAERDLVPWSVVRHSFHTAE